MKDTTSQCTKTRREREKEQASKRDDYIDCLLHPPSALCFFFFNPSRLLLLHYSPKKHCFSAQNRINQRSPLQHCSPSTEEELRPIGATSELMHQ